MLNSDLHSHSTASDGVLPPADVVLRAATRGVELLALTDHDDLSGIAPAAQAAAEVGIGFVSGVEASVGWNGVSIHIVGLGFQPDNAALAENLAGVRTSRLVRGERIAADLERIGIGGALEGALRYTKNPQLLSRAHFARYLVEAGCGRNISSVFEHYLVPGKPGYVEHRWPSLEEAVGWIIDAGGVAVVAHPGRYKLSAREMRRFLDEFRAIGGRAIEVVSGSHSAADIRRFASLARRYGFLASRGSDFHAPEESVIDLGRLAQLPDGLEPVWRLFY